MSCVCVTVSQNDSDNLSRRTGSLTDEELLAGNASSDNESDFEGDRCDKLYVVVHGADSFISTVEHYAKQE